MKEQTLILASSSKYRRELLDRLGIPFRAISPEIDETAMVGETPMDLVERLSLQKARFIGEQFPEAWIIGSDHSGRFLWCGYGQTRKS
jgi:septum formation protein